MGREGVSAVTQWEPNSSREPWRPVGHACTVLCGIHNRDRYDYSCKDCFYGGMGTDPPKEKVKVTVTVTLAEKEAWEEFKAGGKGEVET